jgi:hypothetical protein
MDRPHSRQGILATCLAAVSLACSGVTQIPAFNHRTANSSIGAGMLSPFWIVAMVLAAYAVRLGLRTVTERETHPLFRATGIGLSLLAIFAAVRFGMQ